MVIEEIISELDKFITKYKERKDSAEKGISLRNNIKQALTEKGIQGADALDDSAIVERIKTLPSSGNTTVEGTQGNNSINETYAQQVIQILKENHIPFLNSKEDNVEEFKKYASTFGVRIRLLDKAPTVDIRDSKIVVEVTPNQWGAVNVDYVADGQQHSEMITSTKLITGVTKFSYQECDYYGVLGSYPKKEVYLNAYGNQINHPENYTFNQKNDRYGIKFDKLVDNSDYDILDFRDSNFYLPIAKSKAKEIDSNKTLQDISYSIDKFNLNGNIKVAIVDGTNTSSLGIQYATGDVLKNLPKYLVIMEALRLAKTKTSLFGKEVQLNNWYDLGESRDLWNERYRNGSKSGTVIYRWDSTQNKYMFESVDTLEDWLKTHPLETL